MSATQPNILIGNEVFVNVSALSGTPIGTSVVISNRSTSPILLQTSVAQPASDSNDGEYLGVNSDKIVTFGEDTIWAKSLRYTNSEISVQETF